MSWKELAAGCVEWWALEFGCCNAGNCYLCINHRKWDEWRLYSENYNLFSINMGH